MPPAATATAAAEVREDADSGTYILASNCCCLVVPSYALSISLLLIKCQNVISDSAALTLQPQLSLTQLLAPQPVSPSAPQPLLVVMKALGLNILSMPCHLCHILALVAYSAPSSDICRFQFVPPT